MTGTSRALTDSDGIGELTERASHQRRHLSATTTTVDARRRHRPPHFTAAIIGASGSTLSACATSRAAARCPCVQSLLQCPRRRNPAIAMVNHA
jgi:hypothetical protein